jgi:hypothetical protein
MAAPQTLTGDFPPTQSLDLSSELQSIVATAQDISSRLQGVYVETQKHSAIFTPELAKKALEANQASAIQSLTHFLVVF